MTLILGQPAGAIYDLQNTPRSGESVTILVGKVCMLTAFVPEVVDLIGSELQPKPGKICIAQGFRVSCQPELANDLL